ncbi:type VI secretion system baseplate subunit TssG [Paraburkholderia sp.]|uniref:type VI secretion system baseplate subunit TssG n=1 Tax=Paraburkholderia sp. TaxID=1926495 RepID=UPI00239C4892|nr:type VI secretion system baseplate subunit TssG [Paraburkholderia sp.]MDE1183230.1 type VI secretion system baseplate subunit TssG [Paraburkholderia sp.]
MITRAHLSQSQSAQPRQPPSSAQTATPTQEPQAARTRPNEPHRPAALAQFWQRVADAPYAYDLYTLLRHIDARAGSVARLGRASHPGDEPLRIGQTASLAFAPATLADATPPSKNGMARVSIYSFGLFGPNGPLPLHLTELARDRLRNHGDRTFSAFADLFHHRLILLFYRAWADAQPTVSLDRSAPTRHTRHINDDSPQPFDRYLASLIHLGHLPARETMARPAGALPSHAMYFAAGHLARQTRNPEGLTQILRSYFRVPVEIVEWVAHWVFVPPAQRTRLRAASAMQRLGAGARLGVAVRDVSGKFEIRLGPLSHEQYAGFLPGSRRARELMHWVRVYVGVEWAWDVRLLLAANQARGITLGNACAHPRGGPSDRPQPLGWGSCLGTRSETTPIDDLVYSPESGPQYVAGSIDQPGSHTS